MSERWFCLDCHMVGELTRTGRCSTCGSEAVSCEERPTLHMAVKDLRFPDTEMGRLAHKVMLREIGRNGHNVGGRKRCRTKATHA